MNFIDKQRVMLIDTLNHKNTPSASLLISPSYIQR